MLSLCVHHVGSVDSHDGAQRLCLHAGWCMQHPVRLHTFVAPDALRLHTACQLSTLFTSYQTVVLPAGLVLRRGWHKRHAAVGAEPVALMAYTLLRSFPGNISAITHTKFSRPMSSSLPLGLPWMLPLAWQQTLRTQSTAVKQEGLTAQVQLVSLELPTDASFDSLDLAPSAEQLGTWLELAHDTARKITEANPNLQGMDKLKRRIERDLHFVHLLLGTAPSRSGHARPELTLERVQGLINNLRGFEGELLAAHLCPGVVRVLGKYSTHSSSCAELQRRIQQAAAASTITANTTTTSSKNSSNSKKSAKDSPISSHASAILSVEVDVVAQGGGCWVEVKNQQPFGLESIHWKGGSRPSDRGLRGQVHDLLAAAAAPCNAMRWTAPRVVLFFQSAVHGDVQRELQDMGVHVAVGAASLTHLPPPPPMPLITNLDVTAMCALVSEVSYAFWHHTREVAHVREHIMAGGGAGTATVQPQATAAAPVPAAAGVDAAAPEAGPTIVLLQDASLHAHGQSQPPAAAAVSSAVQSTAQGAAAKPAALSHASGEPQGRTVSSHSPQGFPTASKTADAAESAAEAAMQSLLQRWCTSNIHWQQCVEGEMQAPVLAGLLPHLPPACRLVAASSACDQFEVLLAQYGGPRERRRWAQLRACMQVYEMYDTFEEQPHAGTPATTHSQPNTHSTQQPEQQQQQEPHTCGANGPTHTSATFFSTSPSSPSVLPQPLSSPPLPRQPIPPRVCCLSHLTRLHMDVMGLADALHAVTLSANGSMLRSAGLQGVGLEACVHRAVWLTGQ